MPNDVSGKKLERSANIVIPFEGEKFVGILVDRDRGSGAERSGGGGVGHVCSPLDIE